MRRRQLLRTVALAVALPLPLAAACAPPPPIGAPAAPSRPAAAAGSASFQRPTYVAYQGPPPDIPGRMRLSQRAL